MNTRWRALKHVGWITGGTVLLAGLWGVGDVLTSTDLKAGDLAPDFRLPASDGRTYSLADYKGKQAVVLAWFPKAFTGG